MKWLARILSFKSERKKKQNSYQRKPRKAIFKGGYLKLLNKKLFDELGLNEEQEYTLTDIELSKFFSRRENERKHTFPKQFS